MSTDHKLLRMMQDELGQARARAKSARKDVAMFGMYGDCGDDYNDDYKAARAVVEYLEELLPRLTAKLKLKEN